MNDNESLLVQMAPFLWRTPRGRVGPGSHTAWDFVGGQIVSGVDGLGGRGQYGAGGNPQGSTAGRSQSENETGSPKGVSHEEAAAGCSPGASRAGQRTSWRCVSGAFSVARAETPDLAEGASRVSPAGHSPPWVSHRLGMSNWVCNAAQSGTFSGRLEEVLWWPSS